MKYLVMALVVVMGLLFWAVPQDVTRSDGTKTLGPPSIAIADGSGIVAAGTGLLTQPGTIDLNVPGAVAQALLYWEGFHREGGDNTINVNDIAIIGTFIGGDTVFFDVTVKSSTYRADITSLGLVTSGLNSLKIDGADFDFANNGAGLLVIFDDGTTTEIQLRDGNDLAFINFAPPLDTTVPQTFSFAADTSDRTANLSMFFSSVAGTASTLGPLRPSVIEITVGDGATSATTKLIDQLDSADSEEWDTLNVTVEIPAGANELTVQALSRDDGGSGQLPASFVWNAAALSVASSLPPPPPPQCDVCKGGVTALTLKNNGPEAHITVVQKNGDIVFDAVVPSGDSFSFVGTEKSNKLGKEIKIFVDGVEHVKIHTSCSKAIGPGLTFGDFEVEAGESKDNGPICPLLPPPDTGSNECTTKVISMTLEYTGTPIPGLSTVVFEFKKKGMVVLNNVDLSIAGTQLTVAAKDGGEKEFGAKTEILIDGGVEEVIHTSCSTPFVADAPAPLDSPKGNPSPTWFVVSFTQK